MLYIEFVISEENKFQDFVEVYHIIKEVQTDNRDERQILGFWKKVIPEYSQQKFNVNGESPSYFPFQDMMTYLHHTLEVDYTLLEKTTEQRGRMELIALSYPYGGLERLILFLKTFGLITDKANAGFGERKVIWSHELDFAFEK